LARSEFVIDLTENQLVSSLLDEYLSDIRVLALKCSNTNELKRLVISSGVARRVQVLERLTSSSREIKILTDEGSSLSGKLSSVHYYAQTGIASQIGQREEWPSGIFHIIFDEQQINGKLLVRAGDVFIEANRILSDPVQLEIENGNLVEILGDSADANLMRTYLLNETDIDLAYQINGISLGLALTRDHRRGDLPNQESLQFSHKKYHAGKSSIHIGNSMTLTFTKPTVCFDDQIIFKSGELTGVLQPDPYERTAAGINIL
tara:strand:- start:635 stop:1420 length:786 start_codon:yes stop_codon:yes gene_type:complete